MESAPPQAGATVLVVAGAGHEVVKRGRPLASGGEPTIHNRHFSLNLLFARYRDYADLLCGLSIVRSDRSGGLPNCAMNDWAKEVKPLFLLVWEAMGK